MTTETTPSLDIPLMAELIVSSLAASRSQDNRTHEADVNMVRQIVLLHTRNNAPAYRTGDRVTIILKEDSAQQLSELGYTSFNKFEVVAVAPARINA